MKSGNLNFLESSGPLQACNGTELPLHLPDYTVLHPVNCKANTTSAVLFCKWSQKYNNGTFFQMWLCLWMLVNWMFHLLLAVSPFPRNDMNGWYYVKIGVFVISVVCCIVKERAREECFLKRAKLLRVCRVGGRWVKYEYGVKVKGKVHPCTGTEVSYSAPLYRHWGSVQAVRPIGGVEV